MASKINLLSRSFRQFGPSTKVISNFLTNGNFSKRTYHVDDTLTGISDEQRQVRNLFIVI